MIKVKYNGRFGNNIFQYVFGRILAEEKGYFLESKPIPCFKNTYEKINGKKLPIKHTITGQLVIFDGLLKLDGGIQFQGGHFERYEYYKPYKDRIKKGLEISKPKSLRDYKITKDDCIVHMRMGDVGNKKIGIGFEDTDKMIKNVKFKNLYICTDDIKNVNCREICKKYNATFIMEDVVETFRLIKEFKKIILAPSTFSGGAAGLSDADEVYLPGKEDGSSRWSDKGTKERGLDLRVDEDRYKTVIL